MKRNITRIIVAAALVSAIAFYAHWRGEQERHGQKAQSPNCINNLMQLGMAMRFWADEHNGQFPFNVSTNDGGTKEFAVADSDGFAPDAAVHFSCLTNQEGLATPLLLLCPQDHTKKAARTVSDLKPENVTYRLHIGTNLNANSAHLALVVCPIDGNTLFTDGKVLETKPSDSDGMHPMRVP